MTVVNFANMETEDTAMTAPSPFSDRNTIFNTVLDTVGSTPMVRINRLFSEFPGAEVLAKLEFMNPGGSMKDRIGMKMIELAEKEGRIKPGDTLVEPTSGNTGIGLAQAAAVKGYKLIITMPMKMSEEKRRLLKAYGAELILTPTEYAFDHPEGYIEIAKKLARENDHIHLLNQYINAGNPTAHYEGTGPEIWEQTSGKLDYFVSGMGTGGTISGVSHFLKEKNPQIQIIGVDPDGSIYTGKADKPYQVEGIGYDFYPDVFDTDSVDKMYRISDKESFTEVRRLAKEEGILAGGSTGTVLAGLRRLLTELDKEGKAENIRIVMMVHDNGRSYLSKIYNDDWMAEHGFLGEGE
ncbi:MAG: cysteine synthase family protein [Alphaproteobacteria bacterium]|nr:MAG: cysteine synthase family protein [Alphaproteobacteria bacterium]